MLTRSIARRYLLYVLLITRKKQILYQDLSYALPSIQVSLAVYLNVYGLSETFGQIWNCI